jgi:hypothetical protein
LRRSRNETARLAEAVRGPGGVAEILRDKNQSKFAAGSAYRGYLHGTNFLTRLVSALCLEIANTNQRLHAASVGYSFVCLGHRRDRRELLHHLVVPECALNAHGRLSRPHPTVLSFEQLDLFVEKILRQLIASAEKVSISAPKKEREVF